MLASLSRFSAGRPVSAGVGQRSPRRAAARAAGCVCTTEWILDVPGAQPYRAMEQSGGEGSVEKRTTFRPLPHASHLDDIPDEKMRRLPPINVTQLLEQGAREVLVGDQATFKEANLGDDARLAIDLTETLKEGERALAGFSMDEMGEELVVRGFTDSLHVDDARMGKGPRNCIAGLGLVITRRLLYLAGHKVRLFPGYTVDLSGNGCIFQVNRDERAHA